jgi:hypothetical protein
LAIIAINTLSPSSAIAEDVLYTRFNVHFQQQFDRSGTKETCKASYANFTNPGSGHMFLPPGTPVTIEKNRRGLLLIPQSKDMEIIFEYSRKNMMGMNKEEYIDLIFSPEPVSLGSFSELDLQGIQDGKALVGMTKEGVKTALGYPAKHRTPSLEENTWVFWQNRFRTTAVVFDDTGKVVSIK